MSTSMKINRRMYFSRHLVMGLCLSAFTLFSGHALKADGHKKSDMKMNMKEGMDKKSEMMQGQASVKTPEGKSAQLIFLGLDGYSPVSYIESDKAMAGSPIYRSTYRGVTYFFTSEKEKEMFGQDPEKYLPAFGGYCVKSLVVGGRGRHGSPKCFKKINGKTHLFSSEEAMKTFETGDKMMQIKKAQIRYKSTFPGIHGGRRN